MRVLVRTDGLERIEWERLRARVARLLAALQELPEAAPPLPGAWMPPVDLSECAAAIHVAVELPGVRADEIELTLTATELRISCRKKRRAPKGGGRHLCSERSYGRFERVVPLRWPVRVAAASAELRDGLLVARLPKLVERRGAAFKVPVSEA